MESFWFVKPMRDQVFTHDYLNDRQTPHNPHTGIEYIMSWFVPKLFYSTLSDAKSEMVLRKIRSAIRGTRRILPVLKVADSQIMCLFQRLL